MSEYIIDFEEVDVAVAAKFSGLIIDDREVPVTIYNPDVDFEDFVFPLIVLYRSNETFDAIRRSVDPVIDNIVKTIDPLTGEEVIQSMDKRNNPEPYNIYYTVRMYTDYHTDMNKIRMFYRKQMTTVTYITIKGVKYDVTEVSFSLTGSGYKDFGRTEEGVRKFAEQYLIKVETSLDLWDRTNTPAAQEFIPRIE
ncbi:hypothetical protein D1872_130090 [compost metagenome]